MLALIVLVVVLLVLCCKKTKVTRFYSPTCPHCINSEEKWKAYKNINPQYTFVEINTADLSNKNIVQAYNVTSVPTIVCEHELIMPLVKYETSV